MEKKIDSSTPKKGASRRVRTTNRRVGERMKQEERLVIQEKFLKSFAGNGNVRAACMAAGVDRSIVHYWAEHDEQFSMQYTLAKEDVNDAIRAEIFRRAMFGEEEPVISMGKPIYEEVTVMENGKPVTRRKMLTIKRKSDLLLMFQAKARMPEYREKSTLFMKELPKEYIGIAPDEDGIDL